MGNPLGPIIANLYALSGESKYSKSKKFEFIRRIRYVDDLLVLATYNTIRSTNDIVKDLDLDKVYPHCRLKTTSLDVPTTFCGINLSRYFNLFVKTSYSPGDPIPRQYYVASDGRILQSYLTKKEMLGIQRGFALAKERYKNHPIFEADIDS